MQAGNIPLTFLFYLNLTVGWERNTYIHLRINRHFIKLIYEVGKKSFSIGITFTASANYVTVSTIKAPNNSD